MSPKSLIRLSLAVVTCFVLSIWLSCKHQPGLPVDITGTVTGTIKPPPIGISCSPDTVYFVNTILPLLQANCAITGCHNAATAEKGVILSTYAGVRDIAFPGDPAASKLYGYLNGNGEGGTMPPSPHPALTQAEIQEVYNWISQGAKDNQCTECDTTNMSYSTNILPILQSECYSCHSGSAPVSGIILSSYSAFLPYVQNGDVEGDINGLTGHHLMPQSGALPQCYINQIDAWIHSGAANN